jgi:predicted phosphodiesterase
MGIEVLQLPVSLTIQAGDSMKTKSFKRKHWSVVIVFGDREFDDQLLVA